MLKKLTILFSLASALWAQPGTFTVTGATNNTTMSFAVTGANNTCDPGADYQTTQAANNAAMGGAGCVKVDSTSTNQGAVGLQGSVQSASTATNSVGGYFPVIASGPGSGDTDATRVRLWGFNPVLWDGANQHVLMTNELDFSLKGAGNKILGLQLTGIANTDMSADSAGFLVGPLSGHKWPVGYYCTDGSATTCIYVGAATTGNGVDSQPVHFASRTSAGVNNSGDVSLTQYGGFKFTESAGSGWAFVNNSGTTELTIQGGGGITQNQGTIFAGLTSAFPNGSFTYCPDCVNASNPCTGSGTGAFAKKLNGAWDCR